MQKLIARKITRIVVFCGIMALVLFLSGCGNSRDDIVVKFERNSPPVTVYGWCACVFTKSFLQALDDKQIPYTFWDLDSVDQIWLWERVIASPWYDGGSVKLPLVDVKGVLLERPSIEEIISMLEAR